MSCVHCTTLRSEFEKWARLLRECGSVPEWVPMTLMDIVRCTESFVPQSVVTWISVAQRLPDSKRDVLISLREGCETRCEMGYFCAELNLWRGRYGLLRMPTEVTHWGELPKAAANYGGSAR